MDNNLKLICFDLNKTLINENTWYNLNLAMGITPEEDREMFDLYSKGKLTYIDWQKKLEEIYIKNGKATKENILNVINKYTFEPGAKETINYLRSKNYRLSLISGSIDVLVEKIANELGITYFSANNIFIFDRNNYLSEIQCLGEDINVKVDQLKELCQTLDIDVKETCCIGDGDNDLELFKLCQHGITFKGSKIESHAWKVIDRLTDLQSIL